MGMSYFLVQKCTHVTKVSCFSVHLPFVLAPRGFARLCEALEGIGSLREALGGFGSSGEVWGDSVMALGGSGESLVRLGRL